MLSISAVTSAISSLSCCGPKTNKQTQPTRSINNRQTKRLAPKTENKTLKDKKTSRNQWVCTGRGGALATTSKSSTERYHVVMDLERRRLGSVA